MKEMKVMLTGARPTGPMHLGHYVGTLQEWISNQEEYELFIIIADLHMLTTKNSKADIQLIRDNARNMVADSIAAGIDPAKANFYLQSAVPEITEIYTLLQSLVTVPRLERIPSLKEMSKNSKVGIEMPFALLGYPVLQSADVLCVKGSVVPVGKDNEAHLEVTREIARRFNHLYKEDYFPVPETILSDTPTLIGTDGKSKMSKSLNNAIYLSDEANSVKKKVKSMFTDPNRIRADVPGKVEGNPVFEYLEFFSNDRTILSDYKRRYLEGAISDSEVKDHLFDSIESFLQPIRNRRKSLCSDISYIDNVILEGTGKTRDKVKKTLLGMKKAMGFNLSYLK